MAIRRCPRPEWYTDSDRLRSDGFRGFYRKGCSRLACGFCGPRLADDWARAIAAAEPTLEVWLPVPDAWPWERVRKNINAVNSALRRRDPDAAAVWWAEELDGHRVIHMVRRDSEESFEPFESAARRRGFRGLSRSPLDEDTLVLFALSVLAPLRDAVYIAAYEVARDRMRAHLNLQGGGEENKKPRFAHVSGEYFGPGTWKRPAVKQALARTSLWRNRPMGPVRVEDEVRAIGSEGGEVDLVWHDESWWNDHESSDARIREGYEPQLNPYNPPDDVDAGELRRLEEAIRRANHPRSEEGDQGTSSDSAAQESLILAQVLDGLDLSIGTEPVPLSDWEVRHITRDLARPA